MKNAVVSEMLKKLKSNPQLARKLKVFALVGIVGIILAGGLAIWVGISAVNYVFNTANQVVSSPTAQQQLNTVKDQLQQVEFQPLSCWNKTQNLLTAQPWLESSAIDNLRNLKTACFYSTPTTCEGSKCLDIKNHTPNEEREMI